MIDKNELDKQIYIAGTITLIDQVISIQGLEKTLEDIRRVAKVHPSPLKGKEIAIEAWENIVLLSMVINKMCGKDAKD